MSETPLPEQVAADERALKPSAFQGLLKWLGETLDSEGEVYVEMRRRLVSYFDRKSCLTPDDLADETLNRVARRLEQEGEIQTETPAKYCFILARFVFMEHLRESRRSTRALEEIRHYSNRSPHHEEERESKEKMLSCLEGCLQNLESSQRELIQRYYMGKERVKIMNRRDLAKELEITLNALSIRATRIRRKLEACVKQCMDTE